jgi:hypothetical protein
METEPLPPSFSKVYLIFIVIGALVLAGVFVGFAVWGDDTPSTPGDTEELQQPMGERVTP